MVVEQNRKFLVDSFEKEPLARVVTPAVQHDLVDFLGFKNTLSKNCYFMKSYIDKSWRFVPLVDNWMHFLEIEAISRNRRSASSADSKHDRVLANFRNLYGELFEH